MDLRPVLEEQRRLLEEAHAFSPANGMEAVELVGLISDRWRRSRRS